MRGRTNPFAPSRVFGVRSVRWMEVDWHVLVIAFALLGVGLLFIQGIADSTSNEISRDVSFEAHRQKVFVTLPLLLAGMLRLQYTRGVRTPLSSLFPSVDEEQLRELMFTDDVDAGDEDRLGDAWADLERGLLEQRVGEEE